MIICKACGERQDDGTVFCGRCGAFLEWEGEALRSAADGAPAPAGESTDAQPGVGATDGPETDPGRSAVPVRQPAAAVRRSQAPAPARLEQLPSGSLICGSCGAGNDPERRFCRSCGGSLAGAQAVRRPPWWRRLFRGEKTYLAGTRRRPKNRIRRGVRWVAVLAAVAAVVAVVGPLRPRIVHAFHQVKSDATAPVRHVHPDAVTASGAVAGHAARRATDGASNTYWAAPKGAVRPYLRATFAPQIHLVEVGITAGVSTRAPAFLASARPHRGTLIARTTTGEKQLKFTLDDTPGFQKIRFDVKHVKIIRVVFDSSRGPRSRLSTAVTEVEFFARG